jgi:hypothetical protein
MTWNSYNKKYYIDLGYEFTTMNDTFILNIEDLNKNSHYKVLVSCDICNEQSLKVFKHYNNCLKNNKFYACSSCRFKKTMITNNKKYGCDNQFQIKEIKNRNTELSRKNSKERLEKRTRTNLIKYGCENPFQIDDIIIKIKHKIRQTKIQRHLISSDENISDFLRYKKQVTNITNKIKKELFKQWDGYDYYDGEYIKDNFCYKHTDRNYPTIDHKISTYHGFNNNIPPEKIGGIDNLCITKKYINNNKSIKTDKEFLQKYNL